MKESIPTSLSVDTNIKRELGSAFLESTKQMYVNCLLPPVA